MKTVYTVEIYHIFEGVEYYEIFAKKPTSKQKKDVMNKYLETYNYSMSEEERKAIIKRFEIRIKERVLN